MTRPLIDTLRVLGLIATIGFAITGAVATNSPLIEATLIVLIAAMALAAGMSMARATPPDPAPSIPTTTPEALAVLGSIHLTVGDINDQVGRMAKLQVANLAATRDLAAGYEQGAPSDTDAHRIPAWDPPGEDVA